MFEGDDSSRILVDRAVQGDLAALATLFDRFRAHLTREIARDLTRDPRLAARFDASDVVQEVFQDARQQIASYSSNRDRIDFLGWLRGLAKERRLKFQRDHLDAKCRTVKRQQSLPEGSWGQPEADEVSPSHAARSTERNDRVRHAILQLKSEDRDIIHLRVLKGMTNSAAAERLGITSTAAAKRLERAMARLRRIMVGDASADSGGELLS